MRKHNNEKYRWFKPKYFFESLKDVLFVPNIESNLISSSKATQNGCKVIFEGDT